MMNRRQFLAILAGAPLVVHLKPLEGASQALPGIQGLPKGNILHGKGTTGIAFVGHWHGGSTGLCYGRSDSAEARAYCAGLELQNRISS